MACYKFWWKSKRSCARLRSLLNNVTAHSPCFYVPLSLFLPLFLLSSRVFQFVYRFHSPSKNIVHFQLPFRFLDCFLVRKPRTLSHHSGRNTLIHCTLMDRERLFPLLFSPFFFSSKLLLLLLVFLFIAAGICLLFSVGILKLRKEKELYIHIMVPLVQINRDASSMCALHSNEFK